MKDILHIQSKEARIKAVNRFCLFIAWSAIPYVFVYTYLKMYTPAIVVAAVSVLFSFFVFLNKKSYYQFSRAAIIAATNLGVLFFSIYLGFDSGIYLYLYASPMLVYLLFDFNKTGTIILNLLLYVMTFLLIYFNDRQNWIIPVELTDTVTKMIYAFNFTSTFIMCFFLIYYFANNNHKYISHLKHQQDLLVMEIDQKNESQKLLQKSLKEREMLLAEIHHRVKNNLAVVSGLLELQTSYIQDEGVHKVILESKNRIKSIALLHEKLYENKTLGKVDVKEFINELIGYVQKSFNQEGKSISLSLLVDSVRLNIDEAMPLSLILNELLTNSYKHAFVGRDSGTIKVQIKHVNSQLKIDYSDDGPGLQSVSKDHSQHFGLTLIDALVYQLEAEYQLDNKIPGFHFLMTMTLTEK